MRRGAKQGTPLAVAAADTRDRLRAMQSIASRFEGWRPASEVLVPVRGVRTIFPSVDLATRVGGWPIDRVALVHGPSNNGKTEFMLGLGKSFLELGHYFAFVDAEYTTPTEWLRQLGIPLEHPGFLALRPRSYEETVDAVRRWASTIGEAKERGEIPRDTSGLVVVDSIRKLVPKELLKKLLKEGADEDPKQGGPTRRKSKRGIDGMGGRAAQYKAALNSQWMDEVIPLMAHCGTSLAIITREIEDPDADPFSGKDYKLTGGRHLFFDSSLVVRILSEKQITDGEGASRRLLGERHRVEIHKTKVGKKEDRIPRAHFHTSNGALVPQGFDLARDLLDVGQELGVVELKGSYYSFGGRRIGQGEHASVKALHAKPDMLAELDAEVRGAIDSYLSRESAKGREVES